MSSESFNPGQTQQAHQPESASKERLSNVTMDGCDTGIEGESAALLASGDGSGGVVVVVEYVKSAPRCHDEFSFLLRTDESFARLTNPIVFMFSNTNYCINLQRREICFISRSVN